MQANPKQEGLASLTNNQKALTAYYGLKVCGVKPRDTADVATMARFMHLVLGIPYTSIDRSALYRKLQTVPNFKARKGLVRDLARIKPFFVRLAFHDAVRLIDNDLEIAQHSTL